MNEFTKEKQSHRLRKQTYGYEKGKEEWRDKLGGRISIETLMYRK